MLDIFSDLAAILNLEPFVRMDYGRGADCNLEVIQHIGYPPQVNLIWRGRQRQRQRHLQSIDIYGSVCRAGGNFGCLMTFSLFFESRASV